MAWLGDDPTGSSPVPPFGNGAVTASGRRDGLLQCAAVLSMLILSVGATDVSQAAPGGARRGPAERAQPHPGGQMRAPPQINRGPPRGRRDDGGRGRGRPGGWNGGYYPAPPLIYDDWYDYPDDCYPPHIYAQGYRYNYLICR